MIKKLIYISVCMTLIVACDLEDEYEPQRPQVEDDRNDNRNIGGDVVASRVETPHVNSAFLLVPHYANANGRMVLNYTVEWNAGIRHSSWVAFSWDSTTAAEETSVQRKDNFKWDVDIPRTQGSVSSTDYSKNGYDKGHICASEDCVFCQVTLSVGDGSDNRVGVAVWSTPSMLFTRLSKFFLAIVGLFLYAVNDFFCECCIVLGTVAVRGVLEDALPGSG